MDFINQISEFTEDTKISVYSVSTTFVNQGKGNVFINGIKLNPTCSYSVNNNVISIKDQEFSITFEDKETFNFLVCVELKPIPNEL